ncbi:hypothetical protein Q8A67_023052 [Cirrhinus molitorella]|uniref:Uncharacterized protein n=1 Tax=Cirrhinus molitorella TaxID=172907 RepID=A0AA88TME5_9TELE|nr:hypothetical protein Q8A67_023052 [Cirrhinus molitorella]
MNDLIKSHAKVPGDVGLALRQMKAAPRALQTEDVPERLGERLKAPTAFRKLTEQLRNLNQLEMNTKAEVFQLWGFDKLMFT